MTTAENWPAGNGAVTPVEQVSLGGVSSATVTVKEQAGPPPVEQETVVAPTEKTDPEGGRQMTVLQPPDVAGEKVTTVPHDVAVGEVDKNRLGGHVSVQVPDETAVLAMAELLTGFESLDRPLTVAVLVIVAPGAALTFTTREIVADPPDTSAGSEQMTVPVPPVGGALQLPGLVSDTNVVAAGRLSVKVAPISVSGPLFVTTIA